MRICVASEFGEGIWLAWKMAQEGHDVSAVVHNERYANALGGMVEVMPGGEVYVASKYDLIVWDATGNGKDADKAGLEAPYIGDSVLADELEENREFALDFMRRAGLQVAPYEVFDDPSDGIRYIKKRNRRLVFKPCGEQDDKSTTYCADDAKDMLRYFDVLFNSAKVSRYLLQDYVEGVEVSTEVHLSTNDQYYALNHTLETKKLMNGDIGPNTGCSGSLTWMCKTEDEVFTKGLKRCLEPLAEMGYVGPIDLNTIVNREGIYALEFTPRFGYDATALLIRLLPISFGDFLYAVATGEGMPDLTPKNLFCASVRLSIPPYPSEGLPQKFYKESVPIEGLTEADLANFYVYDVQKRENGELETAGLCGWIGSPLCVGETVGHAFQGVYDCLKRVRVPNSQYRTDICDNTSRRYWMLREGGFLKG